MSMYPKGWTGTIPEDLPLTRSTGSPAYIEYHCDVHSVWYRYGCVQCKNMKRNKARSKKLGGEPAPRTKFIDGYTLFQCRTHKIWYRLRCVKCERMKLPTHQHIVDCLCSRCQDADGALAKEREESVLRYLKRLKIDVTSSTPALDPDIQAKIEYFLNKKPSVKIIHEVTTPPKQKGDAMGEEKIVNSDRITIVLPNFKGVGRFLRALIGGVVGTVALAGIVGLPVYGGLLLYQGKLSGEVLQQYWAMWLMELGPVFFWCLTKWWRGGYKDSTGWDIRN